MANQKWGSIWRTREGGMPPSILVKGDATNTPQEGDAVVQVADGEWEFLPDLPGSASADALKIGGICVHGTNEYGKLYNPGYTAGSGTTFGTAAFGGRGSRAATVAPTNQRFIVPLTDDIEWVTSRHDATAVVVGTAYGYDREATGDYTLDASDAQLALIVTGYYEPDITAGVATTAARVWVRAVSIGSYGQS